MLKILINVDPAGIHLLKVNNRNTRTKCEVCSKLKIKTPERRQWHRSVVFVVNFEHISHVLAFLLLNSSIAKSYKKRRQILWISKLYFDLSYFLGSSITFKFEGILKRVKEPFESKFRKL